MATCGCTICGTNDTARMSQRRWASTSLRMPAIPSLGSTVQAPMKRPGCSAIARSASPGSPLTLMSPTRMPCRSISSSVSPTASTLSPTALFGTSWNMYWAGISKFRELSRNAARSDA